MTTHTPAALTGKQRRFLRGLGTRLRPTVFMGKDGISDALLKSLDTAYTNAELIKARVEQACPIERKEAGPKLAEATHSHHVQTLGRTILLYREDPEDPTIILP